MKKIIGERVKKDRIKEIIKVSKSFDSYEKKLDYLHNKFKDETCYILGCGPSLAEANLHNLKRELQNNLCLTIKISYFSFLELADFHFFNSNNFTKYPYDEKTFVVSSSDFLSEEQAKLQIWGSQESDVNLTIGSKSKNETLSKTKQIEKWLITNSGTNRPWGPGIMYESVLFFAYHLGCNKIKTIGWDYKDPDDKEKISHFYEENWRLSRLRNPAAQPYNGEIKDSIELSGHFESWLSQKGVEVSAYKSKLCFLPDTIKRYEL